MSKPSESVPRRIAKHPQNICQYLFGAMDMTVFDKNSTPHGCKSDSANREKDAPDSQRNSEKIDVEKE